MKKNILYSLLASIVLLFASCSEDKGYYVFDNSALVTFSSAELSIAKITKANNGIVKIPIFRGNTKDAKSVVVEITADESGLYKLNKKTVDFAAGANQAFVEVAFDFTKLTPKPVPVTIAIAAASKADLAYEAIPSTTVVMAWGLTYTKVGTGKYTSKLSFLSNKNPDQDLMKAAEGNYYLLPNCYANGTDFQFAILPNGKIDWYTIDTGYPYGSYGNLLFGNPQAVIVDKDGKKYLEITVTYLLSKLPVNLDPFQKGRSVESFELPAEFVMP